MNQEHRTSKESFWRKTAHYVTVPFWNGQQRRLRTLWRLVLMGLLVYALRLGLSRLGAATQYRVSWAVAALAPAFAALWLAAVLLDRRPFADYGFRLSWRWLLDFMFGIAMGSLLMAGIFLTEGAAGWLTVTDSFVTSDPGTTFGRAILGPLALFIAVGFGEEMLNRGYVLTNLAEGLNHRRVGPRLAIVFAWVLSSALFGALHIGNPNATLISTVSLGLGGLLLGLGYILTGSLALPIGLHIAWNLFQGNVFGFPVSGISFPQARVFEIAQSGPELWTGGAFGPEAGLLGLIAAALGALLTVLWVRMVYGSIALFQPIAEPPPIRGASPEPTPQPAPQPAPEPASLAMAAAGLQRATVSNAPPVRPVPIPATDDYEDPPSLADILPIPPGDLRPSRRPVGGGTSLQRTIVLVVALVAVVLIVRAILGNLRSPDATRTA